MTERRDISAFAMLAIFWGLNYPMLKVAFYYEPPLFTLLFRIIFAMVFAAIIFWKDIVFPRTLKAHGIMLTVSILNISLFMGLWFIGESYVSASLSSVLVYSYPLFNVLLSSIFLRDRPSGMGIIGLIVGFAGLFIISDSNFTGSLGFGIILLILSAVCWAAGTVFFKRFARDIPLATVNVFQYVYSLPVIMVFAFILEGNRIIALQPGFILVTLYLGTFGTAFAYYLYLHLFRRYRVSSISSYFFLVPAVSIVLSAAILREGLSLVSYAGFAVISVGIFFSAKGSS
ncbi:MAG: DMT family transporter [Candidatus Thermoplasmatota archaeon]|nr:DMT family transporter [Candidatus Thermoplasmatota archaeon]MCL5731258.1 DMT family transporter [Candidatus Thermoplasmatota archaeon]